MNGTQFGSIPYESRTLVPDVFNSHADSCNKHFQGSGLIDIPDGGRSVPRIDNFTANSSSEPSWWRGFQSILDALDFYADEGWMITVGINVRYSVANFAHAQ
jgi:hypothetical protein